MRFGHRLGAALAAMLTLLAPALWNGFPLLQYDTGGYLARWFEGYLVPSRSVVYGLFLAAGSPLDFWPVVVLQAAATVWILALVLRAHGFGSRPMALLSVIILLSASTTLPWIAGILLTDIFAGLAVLALHLVMLRADALSRTERASLVAFIAFAGATHSATFLVLIALTGAAALAARLDRRILAPFALPRAAGALALSAALLLGANYAVSRQLSWTPGGYGIVFARMLQDGIVTRYLDDHCAKRHFKLCPYRHQFPPTADGFLWGDSAFNKLGRFAGLGDEMRTIVLESLADYPGLQTEAAAVAVAKQLVSVGTGEGVLTTIWHTYGIMERYTPGVVPAMRAARQQRGELRFEAINAVQVPVALAAMALLPFFILLGWRQQSFSDLGLLAMTASIAIVTNAVVCGTLSNAHDRYGARLAWIPLLVTLLVLLRRRSLAESAPPAELPVGQRAEGAAIPV
jgi:hypothetical protein